MWDVSVKFFSVSLKWNIIGRIEEWEADRQLQIYPISNLVTSSTSSSLPLPFFLSYKECSYLRLLFDVGIMIRYCRVDLGRRVEY